MKLYLPDSPQQHPTTSQEFYKPRSVSSTTKCRYAELQQMIDKLKFDHMCIVDEVILNVRAQFEEAVATRHMLKLEYENKLSTLTAERDHYKTTLEKTRRAYVDT
jgi:hypothetical protein